MVEPAGRTGESEGEAVEQIVSFEGLALTVYVTAMVLLLTFSLGQLHLHVLGRRRGVHRGGSPPAPASLADDREWPSVTIQLPVYNERHVIERLLRTVAAIDYPPGLLEIQLLDDSTDETTVVAERVIAELRRVTGVTIDHIRRPHREGYKAGALASGLESASGELIAVFDADFLPEPDCLRRLVPHFADGSVAAVQARWGHLNENHSTFTRIQAFLLDMHFRFEQPVRDGLGLFINFNGTAGVWRRTAIVDAGGWSADTLTEDIDLSYRAQLRGWTIRYVEHYACPGELPIEMNGFRSQQYRWTKGPAQNARKHLPSIVRSELPVEVKLHAAQHLLASSVYLVILAAVSASVALAALKNTAISADYVDFGLPFLLSNVALLVVFHASRHPRPTGVVGKLRFLAELARFMIFTMGMSLHNGLAAVSGWSGRTSPFVRTPKLGPVGLGVSAYVRRSIDRRVVLDVAALAVVVAGIALGLARREYAFVPLQLMAATGLAWVVWLSVGHALGARRSAGPEPIPIARSAEAAATASPEGVPR